MSRESLTQLTDFERSVYGEPKTLKELEKKYVKFLKSDASLAGKQFICRRLSVFGSDESVSAPCILTFGSANIQYGKICIGTSAK